MSDNLFNNFNFDNEEEKKTDYTEKAESSEQIAKSTEDQPLEQIADPMIDREAEKTAEPTADQTVGQASGKTDDLIGGNAYSPREQLYSETPAAPQKPQEQEPVHSAYTSPYGGYAQSYPQHEYSYTKP